MQSTEVLAGQARRLIGDSPQMKEIRQLIEKASRFRCPVIIQGESGTGKELVARMLHDIAPSHDKPFQVIDCQLWSTTSEPELLRRELMEAAHGGTIFLREIAGLPLILQPCVECQIRQTEVFSGCRTKVRGPWFRVIAATSSDLSAEVSEGRFRQGLYYSLNVLPMTIPPLRERREDIPILAEYICRTLYEDWCGEAPVGPLALSGQDIDRLIAYNWPGNVRELENCLMRATILGSLSAITLPSDCAHRPHPAMGRTNSGAHPIPLDEIERAAIVNALAVADGDKLLAARWLGIGKTTLYRKLKKYRQM